MQDLKAIHAYIACDSEFYAAEVVSAILDVEERIEDFPTAGGIVRERMRRDIRQIKRYSYRIIYQIRPTHTDVLTVVHEKRNLVLED
jgi:toxin ParE1/3/4